LKRIIFACTGIVTFGLGTIGIWIPGLPTVPLYLLSLFLFERSSEKLEKYLKHSKLYQNHVLPHLSEKWTNARLMRLHLLVFVMMATPFILIDNLALRIFLIVTFVLHVVGMRVYFYFKYRN
jgi:uncharacterized membrane protein YbaN (DUF454 family)